MIADLKPILELKGIVKLFPGTRAVDGVNLTVHPGEVVTLLGENGAGKSTLMKILSGVWQAGTFDGDIFINQVKQNFSGTHDAMRAGVAMIHQELSVFPELTIAEHLELDQLPAWIDWDALFKRTQTFLDTLGLGLKATSKVGMLSVGSRQLVEIARAIYKNAKIIVVDEPTSALTDQEVLKLYTVIEKLKKAKHAIIYITHRMEEVFRLSDRMVILRDGQNAGEMNACDKDQIKIPRATLEPILIRWMVGREIKEIYPPKNTKFGEVLIRVENIRMKSPKGRLVVDGVNFEVSAGEIIGFAGLLGAGRSETLEAIFGVLSEEGPRGRGFQVSGDVWIKNHKKVLKAPSHAIESRLGFVSEDRKGSGLVLGQSILRNMMLPSLMSGRADLTSGKSWFSWIRTDQETDHGDRWAKELKIKAASLSQPVGQLSGGNQQKVVLAKWLLTEPEILFLDEPTRGIDVGAKYEIYQWIQRLASQGMAIIIASSEMPEVLGLCHRILVLREGRVSAEFKTDDANQESIMKAAAL